MMILQFLQMYLTAIQMQIQIQIHIHIHIQIQIQIQIQILNEIPSTREREKEASVFCEDYAMARVHAATACTRARVLTSRVAASIEPQKDKIAFLCMHARCERDVHSDNTYPLHCAGTRGL